MNNIKWTVNDANGTSLRGYLYQGENKEEFSKLVAQLITLSGQPLAIHRGDGEKVSVEFTGLYYDQPFTLYDYKNDFCIHIGGFPTLDVLGLMTHLFTQLEITEGTPFKAVAQYDDIVAYQWPLQSTVDEKFPALLAAMNPKLRAILDQIDEALLDPHIGQDLGFILSAVRGPDSNNSRLKRQLTEPIRRAAFPKLAEAHDGRRELGTPRQGWTMSNAIYEGVANPKLDNGTYEHSWHFLNHADNAKIALGLKNLGKPYPY